MTPLLDDLAGLQALAHDDLGRALTEASGDGGGTGAREARLAAVAIGLGRSGADALEREVRDRAGDVSALPGTGEAEGDLRRWLGMATGRLTAAECVLTEAVADSDGEGLLLCALARQAADLAGSAVNEFLVQAAAVVSDPEPLLEVATGMVRARARPGGPSDDALHRELALSRLAPR